MGAKGADFQGLNWQFEVVDGTGGRGEMPNVIDGAIEEDKFGNVLLDEFEVGVATEMGDVVDATGDEVVDADDFVTAGEEEVAEVGAEEASGAGHY